jgi:hypothetical protein
MQRQDIRTREGIGQDRRFGARRHNFGRVRVRVHHQNRVTGLQPAQQTPAADVIRGPRSNTASPTCPARYRPHAGRPKTRRNVGRLCGRRCA